MHNVFLRVSKEIMNSILKLQDIRTHTYFLVTKIVLFFPQKYMPVTQNYTGFFATRPTNIEG